MLLKALKLAKIADTRGVQKVHGPTMMEQRYKSHSMYENTASQYKNFYQEKKGVQILLLSWPARLWENLATRKRSKTENDGKLQKLKKKSTTELVRHVWWENIVWRWKKTSLYTGKHYTTSIQTPWFSWWTCYRWNYQND